MEIKAILNKPYTEKQRLDFIVANNHRHGYTIRDTPSALEAWGKTVQEQEEYTKQTQREALMVKLNEIDLKTVRPLRAIVSADFTDDDVTRLKELEQQAELVRRQIKELLK